jgi:ribosomal protein L11 methyltransferase
MKDYVQISIVVGVQELADILIAQLSEMGFEGFEENDQLLKAYIELDHLDTKQFDSLMGAHLLEYTQVLIPAENWNASWEKNFQPIVIGDFCGVRAAFHEAMEGVKFEIIITPKMSFGTGHHATTWLMIEAMSRLDLQEKAVLDFGTGTGILSILAEKMGAGFVLAMDNDEWSILNAKENIQANQCINIDLKQRDSLEFEGSFDLILANINKNVIINNLQFLSQHLKEDGVVLLSGLLSEDLVEIIMALAGSRFSISSVSEQKNWICLQAKSSRKV